MDSGREKASLLLVDALGLAYRSFYAIRELTGPEGQPTNAVYGFIRSLQMLLDRFRPECVGIVFDAGLPAERLELLQEYKAHRKPMPEDLREQLPVIERLSTAFGWKTTSLEGHEADDVIATLASRGQELGLEVLIVTADKDMLQLVQPGIRVVGYGKEDSPLDSEGVLQKMGVPPGGVVGYLSLLGDSADNIPGVPGVGKKTAAQLLAEHGSIDRLYGNLERAGTPRVREKLREFEDVVRKNLELITLRADLPVVEEMEEFRMRGPADWERLIVELRGQGFERMVRGLRSQGELF